MKDTKKIYNGVIALLFAKLIRTLFQEKGTHLNWILCLIWIYLSCLNINLFKINMKWQQSILKPKFAIIYYNKLNESNYFFVKKYQTTVAGEVTGKTPGTRIY